MADNQIVTNIVATSDFSNLIADVNKVANSLAALQQTISTTNKQLQAQVAVMNRSFADTIRSTGQFSKHFITLTSDVETFGKNLDTGRLKLRDYFRVYQDHVKTSGGLIRDLARQQIQLQNAIVQPLGRNAQGLMQFNVHVPRGLDAIKNKTALARQELQIYNKVIQDGGIQLINWGKNTQWAGRQLTVGLTLPLAAFGKAAADAFKQADQELTRLTKVYGDIAGTSKKELSSIRKEVAQTAKELSAAMGVNFTETIGLAADIAATGKTGNELLSSVKETTRLAVLGEVDRQDAMKATLAIQSAFKQNTQELAESINFLNAVENQTSTTLNDLVEAIPKAGPVIKGLGGNVQDLALYLTAMREGGINASEGANALKSALASLINPTDKAVEKFKGLGIDLLGIVNKNAGNVTATLLSLQAALDKLDPLQKQQAIEQLFGKFQFSRLNALFENLGRQGSQTLQVLDLMKASTAQLGAIANRELAAVTESASGRYKRAVESLKADLAGVGDKFLNIATKLISGLDSIINFLQKLPDPVKNLLAIGGAFTAIVGPVIMLTGVLANFIGYLIKGYGHIKALIKGGEGFKLLTPQMIAAEKAANLVATSLYSDAKAADILHISLSRLKNDFLELQKISAQGGISVQPTISTAAGSVVMPGSQYRRVDPTNPFVGGMASAHWNPRDPNNPATLFGLIPSAEYVNMKIGRNPQIMMEGNLPNVPGLTTIPTSFRGKPYDVSTGVVAGEAARYQALMATLGMQSKAEVAELKKTIEMGGAVSTDFIQTFDDILPITTRISTNAARASAAIVAEARAGKITVQQAQAEIIRINAQLEAMLGAEVTAFAASRGRTIDLTKVPLIDQPVVDPRTGKPNMRALFREGRMQNVIQAVGRATRTRTMGAPYSIHTTLPPGYNSGGRVRGYVGGGNVYETNGMPVPGPNINADVVPAVLTPGEFVLTRGTVQREGSDAVEALHRGEATIVPIVNRHEGGTVPHSHPHRKFLVQAHVTPSTVMSAADVAQQFGANAPGQIGAFAQYYPQHPMLVKDDTTIRLPADINNLLRDKVGGGVTKDKLLRALQTFGPEDIFMDWPELTSQQKVAMHQQLINKVSAFPSSRPIFDNDLSYIFKQARKTVARSITNSTDLRLFNDIFKNRRVGRKVTFSSFDPIARGTSRLAGGANLGTVEARRIAGSITSPAIFTGPQGSGKINMLIPGGPRGSYGIASGSTLNIKSAFYAASEVFKRGFRRNSGGSIPGRAGGYVRRGRQNYGDYVYDPTTGLVLPVGAVGKGPSGPTIHGGNFIPLSSVETGLGGGIPLSGAVGTQQFTARNRMMGMGASILGGTGGSYLGGKLTGGNMLGQMAGFMAGEAAATVLINKYMQLGNVAGQATTKVSLLSRATLFFSKMPGPIKLIALILGTGLAVQKLNDKLEEHRKIIGQAFAPTEDTVEKLKLKYESLNDTLKTAKERMDALEKTGASIFSRTTQTGIPGLTLTIQQLKELKQAVVTDFPDLIEIFNKAKPDEVIGKAAQLKAQFVAGGMSAQDAANMIYALVASSNDATLALQAINDKGFTSIKNGADAAKYSLQVLFDLIQSGNVTELSEGFDQAVNALRNYEKSLVNTKNDQGEVLDRTQALQKTLLLITAQSEKNVKIAGAQLEALKNQNPQLRAILGNVEDTAGAYAKIQLYVMGITDGLNEMNSAAAQAKLIGITSAISELESTTGPFAPLAKAIATQQKIVDSAGTSAAKVFAKTRDQINAEIKLRQKSIATIKEEADARIKSLQEAQEDEDILLKIKEKQLDYQAALAAGDLTGATAAQLEIQGLVRQQQRTTAIRSIQADADQRVKSLEAEIESLQNQLDKAQTKLENAQGIAETAAKKLADLQALMDKAIEAVLLKINNPILTESQAAVINDTKKALLKDFPSISSLLELGPRVPFKEGFGYSSGSPLSNLTNNLLNDAYNKNEQALNVFIKGGSTGFMNLFNVNRGTKDTPYNLGPSAGVIPARKAAFGPLENQTGGQIKTLAQQFGYTKDTYFTLDEKGIRYKFRVVDDKGTVVLDSKTKITAKAMGGSIRRYPGGSTDGPVTGEGTGTSDSIVARLSNGEYVTKAVSVSDVGVDNMHLINTKGTQGLLEAARNIVEQNKALGGYIPSFAIGGGFFKGVVKKIAQAASKGISSLKGPITDTFNSVMEHLGMTSTDDQILRESMSGVLDRALKNKAVLPALPSTAGQAKLLSKQYNSLVKMYRKSANQYKDTTKTVADFNANMQSAKDLMSGTYTREFDSNPIVKDFMDRLETATPEDFAKPVSPDDKAFWGIVTNPEIGVGGKQDVPGLNIPDLFSGINAPEGISLYDYYMGKVAENKLIRDTYKDIYKLIKNDPNLARKLGLMGYAGGGLIPRYDKGGFWNTILNQSNGERRPIFQAKNWEKTANFFSLPEIGRTAQDLLKYGLNPTGLAVAKIAGAPTKSSYLDNLMAASMFIPYGKIPGVSKAANFIGKKFSTFATDADNLLVSAFSKLSGKSSFSPEVVQAAVPGLKEQMGKKLYQEIAKAHPQEKNFMSYLLSKGVKPEEIKRLLDMRRSGVDFFPEKFRTAGLWDTPDPAVVASHQARQAGIQAAFEDAMLLFPYQKGEARFAELAARNAYFEPAKPKTPSPLGMGQDREVLAAINGLEYQGGAGFSAYEEILKAGGIGLDDDVTKYILARQAQKTRTSEGAAFDTTGLNPELVQRISNVINEKGLLDTSIYSPRLAFDNAGQLIGEARPTVGIHSATMRILTDPASGAVYYEKMPHSSLPIRTQYMELFNELYGSRLAGYLGIPAPKTKLGFRKGDMFNPVTLSEDFSSKGWETISERVNTSSKITFGNAPMPDIPPLEILEKQLTKDLGKLTAFVSMIKSADTLANTSNMLLTNKGRLGALDFGFSWDKGALFPDQLAKTETIMGLKSKYLELLRAASFNKYGVAKLDPAGPESGLWPAFDDLAGNRSGLTDEQFARYVYKGISEAADALGSGGNIRRLMDLVLRDMSSLRPELDLRMPGQTLEEMISLQSIFRDKKIGKLAGGGYINPSYFSRMTMPSYFTGAKYLYDDTIAQVHRAEAVLPADMNPWNPAAKNPIGGNSLTYVAPVINAAPGMDIEQLTDVATRKIVDVLSKSKMQSQAKAGEALSMSRRYE